MNRREKIAAIIGKDAKKRFALNLTVYILTRVIFVFACLLSVLQGDYLTAFLCVLALIVFMLPPIIDKKFNIELPGGLEISAVIFTFMCVLGGEFGHLYAQYPLWDKILHTFSGFLISAIGLALIEFLNKSRRSVLRLSPVFIALFAFGFSMSVAVLWEVFEFAVDSISGTTDMQADYYLTSFASKKAGGDKFPTPVVVDGISSVVINFSDGREALVLPGYIDLGIADTMYDLIVASIGSFIFCTVELVALINRNKHARRISESFVPKKRESSEEQAMDYVMCGVINELSEKAEKLPTAKK